MRSILNIAKREFMATVATRAFIIGLLIMPAMLALMGLVMPRLFNIRSMKMQGEILVIDPTGRIMPELKRAFDPARIARTPQGRGAESPGPGIAANQAIWRQVPLQGICRNARARSRHSHSATSSWFG